MKYIVRGLVALFSAIGIMSVADIAQADEASSETITYSVDLGIHYGCEETTASLQAFPSEVRTDTLQVSLSGGTVKEITPTDTAVMLTTEEIALLGSAPSGTFSVGGGEPVAVNLLTSFDSAKGCSVSGPRFDFVRFCPENGVLLVNDGTTNVTVIANEDKFIMVSDEQRTVHYDSNYELHLQAFGPDTESLVDTVVTLDVEHCGGRQPSATFVGVMSCLGRADGTLTLNRDGMTGTFNYVFPNMAGEMSSDTMTFEFLEDVSPVVTAPDGSDVPVTIDLYKGECDVAEPPIPPSTEPSDTEPPVAVRSEPIQVTDTLPPPPSTEAPVMELPATGTDHGGSEVALAVTLITVGCALCAPMAMRRRKMNQELM